MTQARPLAVVTGARRGIGAGIAIELASRGFDIALTDIEAVGAEEAMAATPNPRLRNRPWMSIATMLSSSTIMICALSIAPPSFAVSGRRKYETDPRSWIGM